MSLQLQLEEERCHAMREKRQLQKGKIKSFQVTKNISQKGGLTDAGAWAYIYTGL